MSRRLNISRLKKMFSGIKFIMAICPICGNKRCPKATDPINKCTGSNKSGQPGSDY
jgi:hypothetical protein